MQEVGSWLGLSAGSFRVGVPGGLWVWGHSVPLLGPRGTCHHLLASCVWSRRLHPVPASSLALCT